MTCAAQAAEIFADKISSGERLLDAGCGGGYYYWSFFNRKIEIEYYGLDYTPELIELARSEICVGSGLSPSRFVLDSIENLNQHFDNIICFNVLTNSPHYALPLERLMACTKKRILIRESMGDELIVRYTPDAHLDDGKRHIRVYHNMYPIQEVISFMEENGFRVTPILDRRSRDGIEMVIDIPHQWRILLGERMTP
jgi:SAM-dependent methyltransferase